MPGEPNPDATVITPYRDGPLVIRGPVRLVDQDGREIDVDRRTIALCRCGRSRMRPFCDGTHKLTRFSAPRTARRLRRDRRPERRPAGLPGAQHMPGPVAVDGEQGARAPEDLPGERRLLAPEAPREV